MKEVHLTGGPFHDRTAESSHFDTRLARLVMLWRVAVAPQRGETLDWACLYFPDGRFDRTLEGADARPYFERNAVARP